MTDPSPTKPFACPRDAGTLINVEREGGAMRVLMGKRHSGHKFMPDKFVFSGGAAEPADRRMSVSAPPQPEVEAKLLARRGRTSRDYARGLALAAMRETSEETGLALGLTGLGAPTTPPEGAWARFAATGV